MSDFSQTISSYGRANGTATPPRQCGSDSVAPPRGRNTATALPFKPLSPVSPLTLESFASELAYDFVVTGNVAQSDVHDRFVQSKIPEVKSELYHRATLKAEAFSKIK